MMFAANASRDLAERVLARLPTGTRQRVKRCTSFILPLNPTRIPVVLLRGVTHPLGRTATVLVASTEDWVSYLVSRLFVDAPQREVVTDARLWALPGVLARLRYCADLTLAHVDRLSARLYFDDDQLNVPDWVGTRLSLPLDLAHLPHSRKSVASDLRNTRRHWCHADVSHAPADFDMFYAGMYVPYVRSRHGAHTYVYGEHELQTAFRRGGILWLRRSGTPLAGALFERDRGTIVGLAFGVRGDGVALLKEGAIAALYVHLLDYGRQQGCSALDLRGCRPSLLDGVLRYKRKWGVTLYDKGDILHSTLVHWNRFDDVVAEFLCRTPLILRDGDGFSAVAAVERSGSWTKDELQRARDKLWVSGLRRLALVTDGQPPLDVTIPGDVLVLDRNRLGVGPGALLAAIRASGPDRQ